ncbi:hypothetical protein [Micromonospora tulbaghiae]|uniref:hypothetical protein n=1 Tax=Micromonospora tulbaghiae TaxID=479978 RepID=UPI001FD3882A|nr:hypothetical protein [Micromonospora tulbaghiae]
MHHRVRHVDGEHLVRRGEQRDRSAATTLSRSAVSSVWSPPPRSAGVASSRSATRRRRHQETCWWYMTRRTYASGSPSRIRRQWR